MAVRKLLTVLAASTAILLGTASCSLSSNIATMKPYAPSDGTVVTVDGVKGLNLIYLTKVSDDPTQPEVGGIIGSFVNTTSEPVQVIIQLDSDASESQDVLAPYRQNWVSEVVAPGQKIDLGYNEGPVLSTIALNSNGKTARPGDLITVWIAINDGIGSAVQIPALDGSLEQYRTLVDNLEAVDEHSAE